MTMVGMFLRTGLQALLVTMIASVILIALSIIYFGVTLWVVRIASDLVFGPGLDVNWAVLSAALLAFGGVLASAIERKR